MPKERVSRIISEFNAYIRNTTDFLLERTLAEIIMEVPKNSSKTMCTLNLADEMRIKMKNTGAVNLTFCTSSIEDGACSMGGIVIAPGETQTRTVAELGGEQNSKLNVTNTNPDNGGSCQMWLPLNWERLGISEHEMKIGRAHV